jgi:hypothetical protein
MLANITHQYSNSEMNIAGVVAHSNFFSLLDLFGDGNVY